MAVNCTERVREFGTGGKPVTVSYDGKSVTYEKPDATRLADWIVTLNGRSA